MLHIMLDAVDAGHSGGSHRAACIEGDEAIEKGLIVLAKKLLVVIRSYPEIERAVSTFGVMVDDVAYQDQSGTMPRIARYRVGIEHH